MKKEILLQYKYLVNNRNTDCEIDLLNRNALNGLAPHILMNKNKNIVNLF